MYLCKNEQVQNICISHIIKLSIMKDMKESFEEYYETENGVDLD